MKKILILSLFTAFFAAALYLVYQMRGESNPVIEGRAGSSEQKAISDAVHTYRADDVKSGCAAEDGIFCAVERTVKCTLAPELDGCDSGKVPAFVLGKSDEVQRPTEISFSITKLKPIPESQDISVYTTSDCDAVWFGLCKGTVIYSLAHKDGQWAVTNIYALER